MLHVGRGLSASSEARVSRVPRRRQRRLYVVGPVAKLSLAVQSTIWRLEPLSIEYRRRSGRPAARSVTGASMWIAPSSWMSSPKAWSMWRPSRTAHRLARCLRSASLPACPDGPPSHRHDVGRPARYVSAPSRHDAETRLPSLDDIGGAVDRMARAGDVDDDREREPFAVHARLAAHASGATELLDTIEEFSLYHLSDHELELPRSPGGVVRCAIGLVLASHLLSLNRVEQPRPSRTYVHRSSAARACSFPLAVTVSIATRLHFETSVPRRISHCTPASAQRRRSAANRRGRRAPTAGALRAAWIRPRTDATRLHRVGTTPYTRSGGCMLQPPSEPSR